MKSIPTILLFFAIFLLASCATVQTYEGEALPREEVAVIKSTHWVDIGVSAVIREVDGKGVGFWPGSIMVLPGEHAVKVRVSRSMGYLGTVSAHGTVILHAEAGHTYKVDGEIYGFSGWHWVGIKDEEDDKTVAYRRYHH